jgi:hypothetical protein
MFTELTSPADGILVEILVANRQGVQTGTPLFRIATQDAVIESADDFLRSILDGPWLNRFGLLSDPLRPKVVRCCAAPDCKCR